MQLSSPPASKENQKLEEMGAAMKTMLAKVRLIVPPMLERFHKGQLGRVAVIGGSENYTGAPYFSAMASAKLGADLSHVICTPPAASVIKTYSPNLMVHPIMRESHETTVGAETSKEVAAQVHDMMKNLHAIVIGPGLGRDKLMQASVAEIIKHARAQNIPLVLDADALWLLQEQSSLIKGYKECILTPNVIEFKRLAASLGLTEDHLSDTGEAGCKKLAQALGGVMILRKGEVDWISDGQQSARVDVTGGRKRSGGQGDTLTGTIVTMLAWRSLYHERLWDTKGDFERSETLLLAAYGASALTRECSHLAFMAHGRALQASDLTENVAKSFSTLIGESEELEH